MNCTCQWSVEKIVSYVRLVATETFEQHGYMWLGVVKKNQILSISKLLDSYIQWPQLAVLSTPAFWLPNRNWNCSRLRIFNMPSFVYDFICALWVHVAYFSAPLVIDVFRLGALIQRHAGLCIVWSFPLVFISFLHQTKTWRRITSSYWLWWIVCLAGYGNNSPTVVIHSEKCASII